MCCIRRIREICAIALFCIGACGAPEIEETDRPVTPAEFTAIDKFAEESMQDARSNPPQQDPPPKCTDPTGAEIPCPPEPPRPCNPSTGEQCPTPPPPCVPSTGMCYEAPECAGKGLTVLCSANWATAYIVNENPGIGGVCTRETRVVEECWRTSKKCNPMADLAKGEAVCS